VTLNAPFPAFGGKRQIAPEVWSRFGHVKQYIEPFCFSCAVLLSASEPASLEVIGDQNGFVANFWRATKHQPASVAQHADYPVSHVDLGARHVWLMAQRERIGKELQDPNWPGDAKVAGWWLWGQCCWIGSGWCDWSALGQVPHAGNAGKGIQALGQVPHAGNAGMGIQALGQVPHAGSAGMGELLTSSGQAAWVWLHKIARRLERVRIVHGDWARCLNHHYGGTDTAVFLDPPYLSYEKLYACSDPVAKAAEAWARENPSIRVAICGHDGDYDLPGWELLRWSRGRHTYGGNKTTDIECIWFSPACLKPDRMRQISLFDTQGDVQA
jgi:hypothetical protein